MEKTGNTRAAGRLRNIFRLLGETLAIWSRSRASRMSAALAYYTMLSLAPLLLIAVALAGRFFGDEVARAELLFQIQRTTSDDVAAIVQQVLSNIPESDGGLLTSLVSLPILLFGASGVFSQLFDTMNVIWELAPDRRSGWMYTLRQHIRGLLMVLFIGLLLLASLILSGLVHLVNAYVGARSPGLLQGLAWIETSVSILLLPLVFMLLFRLVPLRRVAWGDVWLGGILTAGLFILARQGIALYLQGSTVTTVYGAAGSLVVLLIWVYFSGMIMFLGAAFCRAYAGVFGSLSGSGQE